MKARYKATLEDIHARYAEWMIAGEPEIRGSTPPASFNPYRQWTDGAVSAPAESNVELQPQRAWPPAIDSLEVLLVATFLRRYVTYCARRRRFAAMQGAVKLFNNVTSLNGSA